MPISEEIPLVRPEVPTDEYGKSAPLPQEGPWALSTAALPMSYFASGFVSAATDTPIIYYFYDELGLGGAHSGGGIDRPRVRRLTLEYKRDRQVHRDPLTLRRMRRHLQERSTGSTKRSRVCRITRW
jgi:hypothetical protein